MNGKRRLDLPAALAALALLSGCVQAPMRPDLERIYRSSAEAQVDATPVIVIPGLFGSKLREPHSGEEVWPGDWQRVLFSDYRELALDPGPNREGKPAASPLEAFDLADRVLGIDFYGPLIDTLARFGGYRPGRPGQAVPPGERRYYVFAYDWRQDNVQHAAALDALIEQIRRDYGKPDLRVDIVAHSMGGIVARYYLRYGPHDVLDGQPSLISLYGTERVRKLVLLGTPNFGAVSALHGFLRGEPIGFKRMPPEVVASMPSAYQLFPHPLAEWGVDSAGQALHDDLYDPATWQRLGWALYDPEVAARVTAQSDAAAEGEVKLAALRRQFTHSLERARRLAWMLSTPEPASPVRYVLFGGNCAPTPAKLAVETVAGRSFTRLKPSELTSPRPGVRFDELMLEPGDGRVTKPSLLARETLDASAPQHEEAVLPIAYYFFLCERHDQLTSNINFQDNLLHILLTRQLPWDTPGR
ncbi:lipase/acyltransferase domain-containing protein [Roseateles sp.]|uniref:lipase/acyltransferase domain-containing protein n=1 Tax=Roseateles sp. TaxID=1971397 RepID=UPI00286ADDB0|nr:hypothetical protein [Roseateles sp.]